MVFFFLEDRLVILLKMAVYYTIVNKEKVNLLGSQGKNLLAISIGASVGTYCRYSLSIWMNNILFPLGTLVGNIMGSFLLGLFTSIFTRIIPKEWLKLGLGVGFCGGFTTMSTFSAEVAHFFYPQLYHYDHRLCYSFCDRWNWECLTWLFNWKPILEKLSYRRQ